MKKTSLFAAVLILTLLFSAFMATTAFAASSAKLEKDGLSVELRTDKSAYRANEEIKISLIVNNNNPHIVKNVRTDIAFGDELVLKSGAASTNGGILSPTEAGGNQIVLTLPAADVPLTGDSFSGWFFVLLAVASLSALIVLVVCTKLQFSRIMVLVICVLLVGAVAIPANTAIAVPAEDVFELSCTVKVDNEDYDITATVHYDKTPYYAVSTVNCSVENAPEDGLYTAGETYTVVKDAIAGQNFIGWSANDASVVFADPTAESTTFTMPAQDVEITALYEPVTCTVTAQVDAGARLEPIDVPFSDTNTYAVAYNSSFPFYLATEQTYEVVSVTANGVALTADDNSAYLIENITEDTVIDVTVEKTTCIITTEVDEGVSFSASPGDGIVDHASFFIFYAKANAHYEIVSITANGAALEPKLTEGGNVYVLDSVTEDTHIKVTAKRISYTVTFTMADELSTDITSPVTVKAGDTFTLGMIVDPSHKYHPQSCQVFVQYGDGRQEALTATYNTPTLRAYKFEIQNIDQDYVLEFRII